MVCRGFSEVIGSWKMIEIRRPRIERMPLSGSVSRSCPSKMISPLGWDAADVSSRSTDSADTVLPEPDSPTSATVSPLAMENDTPFTARLVTLPERNATCRLRTSRRGAEAGAVFWVINFGPRWFGLPTPQHTPPTGTIPFRVMCPSSRRGKDS
jgi:hypothetical protein